MGEISREREAREALIKKFGDAPPILGAGESFPHASGYVLIVDTQHVATGPKGRKYYLGINPERGWVMTETEQDPGLSG